eukprot:GILJ01013648.1.p1 GENE.GILJ01013648.1~~GILJ01013648.1.p1  ORF type:complete len:185 (+),score=25.66 GILJ01013648.1:208-762(+)
MTSCKQTTPIRATEDAVIVHVGRALNRLLRVSSKRQQAASVFDSVVPCNISIFEYLLHLWQYTECSNECFVLSAIYIDRLVRKNPIFRLTNKNIHRIVLTSLVLAIKYQDDHYYGNDVFARIGGIGVNELRFLELEFVDLLGCNFFVRPDVYEEYRRELAQATEKNPISVPKLAANVQPVQVAC